ncbi:MAG: hypothetical protein PHR35_11785 [Kiritimatiellae bacterium]|nr:hypothetical protein [Kiritimatiellia bacterium]
MRTLMFACMLAVGAQAATNLVVNGDFELASPDDVRRPLGWALPDGLGVRWEDESDGTNGKAIWMNTAISERDMVASWRATGLTNIWDIPQPAASAISDTYGLSYYSNPFPIVSGMAYRVRCDIHGSGGVKVWVRGYGSFRGRRTKRYEALLNCEGRAGAWTPNEMIFHPTRNRPEVEELRVMLYAYYPPARYGFDNIAVEPVAGR